MKWMCVQTHTAYSQDGQVFFGGGGQMSPLCPLKRNSDVGLQTLHRVVLCVLPYVFSHLELLQCVAEY